MSEEDSYADMRRDLNARFSKSYDKLHTSEKQDALVERVEVVIARQMMKTVPYDPGDRMYLSVARAAIAVVLEEAAKVAESIFQIHTDPDGTVHYSITPKLIAEDIRAMIPKEGV